MSYSPIGMHVMTKTKLPTLARCQERCQQEIILTAGNKKLPHRESNPGLDSESVGCYRYTMEDAFFRANFSLLRLIIANCFHSGFLCNGFWLSSCHFLFFGLGFSSSSVPLQ